MSCLLGAWRSRCYLDIINCLAEWFDDVPINGRISGRLTALLEAALVCDDVFQDNAARMVCGSFVDRIGRNVF